MSYVIHAKHDSREYLKKRNHISKGSIIFLQQWEIKREKKKKEDWHNVVKYVWIIKFLERNTNIWWLSSKWKLYFNINLQNGPDECELNSLEACALNVLDDVVSVMFLPQFFSQPHLRWGVNLKFHTKDSFCWILWYLQSIYDAEQTLCFDLLLWVSGNWGKAQELAGLFQPIGLAFGTYSELL